MSDSSGEAFDLHDLQTLASGLACVIALWGALCGCAEPGAGPGAAPPAHASPGPDSAAWVGEALCRSCHSVEASHWDETVHARVFGRHARTDLEARGCEGCHGPGAAHVRAPGDPTTILAFTRDAPVSAEAQNAACLNCHRGGSRLYWPGSTHEAADLACSDCHNPMARTSPERLLRESSVSATCFGCHPAQRVQFRKRSHMPLLEGKVSCEDCHAPHGSRTDPLLVGRSVNDTCYACHPEKRGPFLWEHAPVRESCLNCHHPHGSNHEKLLISSRTFLCQGCHAQIDHPSELLTAANLPGGAPDERLLERGCVNCHTQIHGSNHPSGPRFHR